MVRRRLSPLLLADDMRTLERVNVIHVATVVHQKAAVLAVPAAAEAALDAGGGATESVVAAPGHGLGDRDIPRHVAVSCQDLRDAILFYWKYSMEDFEFKFDKLKSNYMLYLCVRSEESVVGKQVVQVKSPPERGQ